MTTRDNRTGALRIGIGIDTGGTFTDAVAVDLDSGELLVKAKRPTTREDLAIGVRDALAAIDAGALEGVELVSLSTTLATNAVVEGKGARVGLIVAVPDPATFALPEGLPAADVAVIAGAHAPDGSLRTPLDLMAARAAVERMADAVDAFAVSAYFSVANSEHELAVKALIAEKSSAPVVCGYELSLQIGMVERATTAALNARLLPLVRDLLDAVRSTLVDLDIVAPLMVVKGDGSLTAEKIARERPVETVLSGPAASVVGACRLSGLTSAVVADMGGTTTDIALVSGGMPEVNDEGALVGGWRTRVLALDVRTVGLGGDSRIRATREGEISIGPDRAVPLGVAALRFPQIAEALERLVTEAADGKTEPAEPLFVTLIRRPAGESSSAAKAVLDLVDGQAVHIEDVLNVGGPFVDIDRLVRRGIVAEIAVTPTDLLHCAGELGGGSREAAEKGVALLGARARTDAVSLLASARWAVGARLAREVAARALAGDLGGREPGRAESALLAHLLEGGDGVLRSRLSLGVPLVAVGAPASAWFPTAREMLGGDLVVPDHADVANAFGALAGRVIARAQAIVKAEPDETFLVVTPSFRERFGDKMSAVTRAEELAAMAAREAAVAAGACDPEVLLATDEVIAAQACPADDVFVEMTVAATALGRPFL